MMVYEKMAGLETHIELSTATKMFCSCTTAFGGDPNTHCCPICTGQPGSLPRVNREAVRLAVMAGLAVGCRINPLSYFDRKNYTYPDLPKAYQITQYDTPLCENGQIALSNGRQIRIIRIHIEEDAGKLIHEEGRVLIDYNRSGLPLIEVVTAPDFRSAEEIKEYLETLQQRMRAIGVSDCRMQEGSMRTDVNLSVKRMGDDAVPTRTEIKNMNSFSNIVKAVGYEWERQIALLEQGKRVVQETLRYDEATATTQPMRDKENAHDYRYFREPDLPPLAVSDDLIAECKAAIPILPEERLARYRELGITEADARQLSKYNRVADYFEAAATATSPRRVAAFILSAVFARMTEIDKEEGRFPLPAHHLQELAVWVEQGKLTTTQAKTSLDKMMDTGNPVTDCVDESALTALDDATLTTICRQVIEERPDAVADYKNGKEKALRALLGGVMKATAGRANPQTTEQMLKDLMGR